jgi:hypothetical protein
LEISKIAIATYLHDKWKETYRLLKIYLTIALVILSVITSIGIYGLLSSGFQKNIAGLEINNKLVDNIGVKKTRFEEIKGDYQKEKEALDKDITNLRNALSNNTTTQSIDRRTGKVITSANGGNRKAFESQLNVAQKNRDIMSNKIEGLNDSVTRLDIEVLDITSEEIESSELGAIKYLSEVTGWDIKKTANFFILTLVFVFDPLAIALVISTNQAFKNIKRKEEEDEVKPEYEEYPFQDDIEIPECYLTHDTVHDTVHDTIQVEPEIIERIVEVPVEVIREVERIVEKIVNVPFDRVVEIERRIEVPIDRIVEVDKIIEIPFKYYVNDNGNVFDDKGNQVDDETFKNKIEEIEKKILMYKK